MLGRDGLPVLRGKMGLDLLWDDRALAGTTDDHTVGWQVTGDYIKRRWQSFTLAPTLLRQNRPRATDIWGAKAGKDSSIVSFKLA